VPHLILPQIVNRLLFPSLIMESMAHGPQPPSDPPKIVNSLHLIHLLARALPIFKASVTTNKANKNTPMKR